MHVSEHVQRAPESRKEARLAGRCLPRHPHGLARQRRETHAERDERMVRDGLEALGWTDQDLRRQSKEQAAKVRLAQPLRRQLLMTRQWIAQRSRMRSANYLLHFLAQTNVNPEDRRASRVRCHVCTLVSPKQVA